MESSHLEKRLRELERWFKVLIVVCILLALSALWMGARQFQMSTIATRDSNVLRLKGLIIEDSAGRARILLGAPFPSVSERLRKDVTGIDMVFLDEDGHDRFTVGEMMPALPGFHRVAPSYGLNIFDSQGAERGGMGFLSNGSTLNRAVIALDRPLIPSESTDAWAAVVDDATGFAGTYSLYSPQAGHDREAITIGTQDKEAFIKLKDVHNKQRADFALDPEGIPSFRDFNKSGVPGPNLIDITSDTSPQTQ